MRIIRYFIYLIAILVILFFALGVINPQVKYSHDVTIERPIELTWEVFMNEELMYQWIPNLKSIELIAGKKNGLGSKYRMIVEDDGKEYEIIETITEIDKHYKISILLENDVLTNEVETIFTHLNGRTKLNTSVEIEGKDLLMKSSLFLMKGHFMEQSDDSYQKLKALVEAQ